MLAVSPAEELPPGTDQPTKDTSSEWTTSQRAAQMRHGGQEYYTQRALAVSTGDPLN